MVLLPTRRGEHRATEELVREAFWDLLAPRVRGTLPAAPAARGSCLPAGPGLGGPGGRSPGGSDRLPPGPGDGGRWGAPPGGHLWPHRGVARLAGAKGGFRPHRDHPPAGRRAGVRRAGHHRRPRLLPPLWLSHRQGLRHPPGRWVLSRGPAGKKLRPGELSGVAGRYCETEVFSLSPGDAGLLAFERGFPPKERVEGTPSRRRFARSAARLSPTTDRQSAPLPLWSGALSLTGGEILWAVLKKLYKPCLINN